MNISHVLVSINDTLCNTVATYNSSKDVYKDGFYIRIFQNKPEGFLHTFGIGSSSHIKEVGWFSTGLLDKVHGRHGQTCSVYHTAYVSVKVNIVKSYCLGFNLYRVLLPNVSHFHIVLVTEQCVVVKAYFGINSHDLVIAGL